MHQKIYPDLYGIDTWDRNTAASVDVHIVNSEDYREITGSDPPPSPIDARTYTRTASPGSSFTTKGGATSGPRRN